MREKHPWKSVNFREIIVGFYSVTDKSRKVSHIYVVRQIHLVNF